MLSREEFKAFVEQMNAIGVNRHGLKHRDTDDAFIDNVYPAFNGYNAGSSGVSQADILTILDWLNKNAQ